MLTANVYIDVRLYSQKSLKLHLLLFILTKIKNEIIEMLHLKDMLRVYLEIT